MRWRFTARYKIREREIARLGQVETGMSCQTCFHLGTPSTSLTSSPVDGVVRRLRNCLRHSGQCQVPSQGTGQTLVRKWGQRVLSNHLENHARAGFRTHLANNNQTNCHTAKNARRLWTIMDPL